MRDTSPKYYVTLWDTLVELSSPDWQRMIDGAARRVERGRVPYLAVQELTGVPWQVIGAIHDMEASSVFSKNLMNGEPWNRKTTIEPVGHGPWKSWEASAVEALEYDGLAGQSDWSIAATAMRFEEFNGGPKWRTRGYAKRGKNSPYLYSGCQHGVGSGKYVIDGQYDPDAVSQQVGAMVILKRMAAMGLYRPGAPEAPERPENAFRPTYDPRNISRRVMEVQEALNLVGAYLGGCLAYLAKEPLDEDGLLGPKTAKAIFLYSGAWPDQTPENVRRVVEAFAAREVA